MYKMRWCGSSGFSEFFQSNFQGEGEASEAEVLERFEGVFLLRMSKSWNCKCVHGQNVNITLLPIKQDCSGGDCFHVLRLCLFPLFLFFLILCEYSLDRFWFSRRFSVWVIVVWHGVHRTRKLLERVLPPSTRGQI